MLLKPGMVPEYLTSKTNERGYSNLSFVNPVNLLSVLECFMTSLFILWVFNTILALLADLDSEVIDESTLCN